ncbi:uncharacterized protein [Cardiocondyla obscurior]|uniref:uncharacterized protein n=1 Tax=Cardiocondyla obscurior TaxID=286306 RepID=UPI0039658545
MSCRDYLMKICARSDCKMFHEVRRCTKSVCLSGTTCKFVHLNQDEVDEINHHHVRPMTETAFCELKRLAYLLRETYPPDQRPHTCTKNLLGECMWECLSCENGTFPKDNTPRCNFCQVQHFKGIQALICGHSFCTPCMKVIPFAMQGQVPKHLCTVCKQWKVQINLYTD